MEHRFSKNASRLFIAAIALVTACSSDGIQGPNATTHVGPVLAMNQLELNRLAGSQILAAQNGRQQRGVQDDMLRIESAAPGFAGFYLDSNGDLVARLSNMANQPQADGQIRALIARREARNFNPLAGVKHVSFTPATFPLSWLIAWQEDLFPRLADMPGFSSIGVSERANQLIVGVTANARASVAEVIRARGVPDAAVSFEVNENAPRTTSSLRGTWRPTFGGIGIKPNPLEAEDWACSLGFNVTDSTGARFFLTASHCIDYYTQNPNGPVGNAFYQPCCGVSNRIGQVSINPPWNLTSFFCAPQSLCTQADVMAVAYDAAIVSNKTVARTTCCYGTNSQPGSIDVSGQWPVTAITALPQGNYVWKLGRTAGLTEGHVSLICNHVVLATIFGHVTVICSVQVSGSLVLPGDSGGPEFIDTNANSRAAAGIVFAAVLNVPPLPYPVTCPAPCISWFSPWSQIQLALNRTVTPY